MTEPSLNPKQETLSTLILLASCSGSSTKKLTSEIQPLASSTEIVYVPEKRASKLGFASLYDYFEDKISKKQKAIEDEQKELETSEADEQPKANKKSCSCC